MYFVIYSQEPLLANVKTVSIVKNGNSRKLCSPGSKELAPRKTWILATPHPITGVTRLDVRDP